MMLTKCHIVILDAEKEVVRIPAVCRGNEYAKFSLKVKGEKQTFEFKGIPQKPAMKMCLEQAIQVIPGYKPQKHRITIV